MTTNCVAKRVLGSTDTSTLLAKEDELSPPPDKNGTLNELLEGGPKGEKEELPNVKSESGFKREDKALLDGD